jgi:hypothetical protein
MAGATITQLLVMPLKDAQPCIIRELLFVASNGWWKSGCVFKF